MEDDRNEADTPTRMLDLHVLSALRPASYLVRKLPVADDRLPTGSRLSTWKKYCVLRARPVIVTEWLLTRVRSRGSNWRRPWSARTAPGCRPERPLSR